MTFPTGESLWTDSWERMNPKFLPMDVSKSQRVLNSNPQFYQTPWKYFPVDNQRGIISQERILNNFQDRYEASTEHEINQRNTHFKKQAYSSRDSDLPNPTILSNIENIIDSIEKFGSPSEYKETTEKTYSNTEINSSETYTSDQKNLMQFEQVTLSRKTQNENLELFPQSTPNYIKMLTKKNKTFAEHSTERNIKGQFIKSIPFNRNKSINFQSECQMLDTSHLLTNISIPKFDLKKFFNPDSYKKCLLLRKINRVDLLIKKDDYISKIIKNALYGDLYSVFKILNKIPENEMHNEDLHMQNKIQQNINRIPSFKEELKVQQRPSAQDETFLTKLNQPVAFKVFVSPLNEKENSIHTSEISSESSAAHINLNHGNNETPEVTEINPDEYEFQTPEAQDRLVQTTLPETIILTEDLKNIYSNKHTNHFQHFPHTSTVESKIFSSEKEHKKYIELEQKEKTSKLWLPVEESKINDFIATNLTNILTSQVTQTEASIESTPPNDILSLAKQTLESDSSPPTKMKPLEGVTSFEDISPQRTNQSFTITSTLSKVIHLIVTEPDTVSTEFEIESSSNDEIKNEQPKYAPDILPDEILSDVQTLENDPQMREMHLSYGHVTKIPKSKHKRII
ncbi:hypothetical protein NPIL_423481 [Nephila pilipes]|uniref:Uncharacterized protein n=1 Tax=Nephila pilipes TaxID=299642 RepID=A0A8X6QTA8_NEPPI|nr:hypothetical protein NPIL_423481 [Nephila pilipes]